MSKRSSRSVTVRHPAAVAALALLLTGAVAQAQDRGAANDTVFPNDTVFHGAPAVSDAELKALRGGVTIMGIDFSFGAIQTVLVDGQPVARTIFTLADDGSLTRTLEILDESLASEFNGQAVPGMNLGSLSKLKGVVVPGEGDGASVVLSGISPGQFASALLNNAANRDIAQHFDIQFSIDDFSNLNSNLSAVRDIRRIAGASHSGIPTRR